MKLGNLKALFAAPCFAAVLASGGVGQATTVHENFGYVTNQSIYVAPLNQDVTVNIYFSESPFGTGDLIENENDLFGAGFTVSSMKAAAGGATITAITGPTSGFVFAKDSNNSNSRMAGEGIVPPANSSGPLPDANGLIALGSVTVQVGAVPTSFEVGPYALGGGTRTFDHFYNLDQAGSPPSTSWSWGSASTSTFTVSTPEPATLILLFGGLFTILFITRRKLA